MGIGKRDACEPRPGVEREVEQEMTRLMRRQRDCGTGKKVHKVGRTASIRLSWFFDPLLCG